MTSPLRPPPSTLPPGSTVWAYLRDSGGPRQDQSLQQQRDIVIEYCDQDGLVIWNFARFSRSGPDESQLYKAVLRTRGIVIHSLADDIPGGDFGPVIETLIDVANKQKKDEAALGAWRGLRHIVKLGAMPGTPPRGFKREPITVCTR